MYYAVFVTGNVNKLKEVRAILANGKAPIEIEARDLDSEFFTYSTGCVTALFTGSAYFNLNSVPEVQGTTQEVAREKCRRAAELVCSCLE